jgi:hypothetical protein
MSAYTPGPWFTAVTSTIGHHYVIDGDGFTICDPSPMGAANARLIASAPALVDVLRCALADLEGLADEYELDDEHPARESIAEAQALLARIEVTP